MMSQVLSQILSFRLWSTSSIQTKQSTGLRGIQKLDIFDETKTNSFVFLISKKGSTDETIKIIIWVLIFFLGATAIYFLFKRLGLR